MTFKLFINVSGLIFSIFCSFSIESTIFENASHTIHIAPATAIKTPTAANAITVTTPLPNNAPIPTVNADKANIIPNNIPQTTAN